MNYIKMIIDLLNSDIKTSEITDKTGLSKQFIGNYKNGKSEVKNMKLEKAEKLILFIGNNSGMLLSEKVCRLLNGKMTSYRIAEETGLTPQFLDAYRNGNSQIKNMGVEKAMILANYYDELKENKIRWMNKSQWNNVAERIDNLDDAKRFLKTNIYGWQTKDGAINNFKHTIMKAKKRKLALNGEPTTESNDPEYYAPWLKELSVGDLADK